MRVRIGFGVGAIVVLILGCLFHRLVLLSRSTNRESFSPTAAPPAFIPSTHPVPIQSDPLPTKDPASEAGREKRATLVSLLGRYANSSEKERHALGVEIVALLEELEVTEILYDILDHETDPNARAMALRTLMAHEHYPRLDPDCFATVSYGSGSFAKDERLVRWIEKFVSDPGADSALRKAAICGLPFLPLPRAETFLRALLSEKGDLEQDALGVLSSILTMDRAARDNRISESPERRMLSLSFRAFVLEKAGETYTDTTAPLEARLRASIMLSNEPAWVIQTLDRIESEPNADLKENVVNFAGQILNMDPKQEKAPWLFDKLVKIASGTGDTEMRDAAIAWIGSGRLQPRFGAKAEPVLTSFAQDPNLNVQLRVTAITVLGEGGYQNAKGMLTELTTDTSQAISVAATEALEELEKPKKPVRGRR
jgi:hypothetical protein